MIKIQTARVFLGALALGAAVVLGSALHLPARAAEAYQRFGVHPDGSCSSANPCLYWNNNLAGPGVQGDSHKGAGVTGRTLSQTNGGSAAAGVLGEDLATREPNGWNMGVEGATGIGIGVLGKAISGTGVEAETSTGANALFAQNNGSSGYAIFAIANSTGVDSLTTHPSASGGSASGVIGVDGSGDNGTANFGVTGESISGTGVLGYSNMYVGVLAAGGGVSASGGLVPSLSVTGNPLGQPADLIDACASFTDDPCANTSPSRTLRLDNGGNLTISGLLFTAGSCSVGCARSQAGVTRRVISYAPTQTVPSIEDFGEARLVDGYADVPLSADFANVIDRGADYLVFITPEGDCNVLYVAKKTAAGFAVRESHDGRSTLSFDYRIVAKPLGDARPRLPVETSGPRVPAAPMPNVRTLPG